MARCLFTTALLALALAPAAPAAAQAARVAIAPLAGRRTAPARRAVRRALERLSYTVSLAESDPGDDNAASARLAEAMDVHAIIGGAARGRGGRWRFELWIRDRAGADRGTVSVRVRGARGIRRLAAQLHDALQSLPAGAAERPAAAVDDGERAAGGESATEAPARATGQGRASAPEPRPQASAPPLQALFLVGAGARSRRVELLSPDGLDAGYRAEPFFEVTAYAQARLLDVMFVRASFGSSAGLVSDRADASLQPVDTLFTWLRADAGASVVVDDTMEFGAAFGLGWDRYELTFNELLPTVEYVHLRPAALVGVHLAGRLLVLDTELGVRIPLGVGDLQAVHGVQYSVLGVDGAMRLRGRLDVGFAWAAEIGFRQYWLTFQRPDGEVTGTDGGWHATGYAGWEF